MASVLSDSDRFVAQSEAMRRAMQLVVLYAKATVPIILVGATGTGKSHLARLVHRLSERRGELVETTLGEVTGELARDELFGHERGAFTGAVSRRRGLFAEAGEGHLFLDNLHDLTIDGQAKLLRALQDGVYRPIGADRDIPVRCRVIVAVREDPDLLVASGVLLPDLRFRLSFAEIWLPPLAERREEILPLAELFLSVCPVSTGVEGPVRFAPDVIPALEAAPGPGNVRELRGVVETAYLHAQHDPEVTFDHLPRRARVAPIFQPCADPRANQRAIEWALWRTAGRVGDAARLIGAHRNTVAKVAALHNPRWRIVQERERRGWRRPPAGDATGRATRE